MYERLTTFIRTVGLLFWLTLSATAASAGTALLMAEEPGCMWCARWNSEIAPIYEKTGEGQAAPLRRMDKTLPTPSDVTLLRAVNFTPTFILLVDGAEVGRIEGYPGEDFFWGLLGALLDSRNIPFDLKPPLPSRRL